MTTWEGQSYKIKETERKKRGRGGLSNLSSNKAQEFTGNGVDNFAFLFLSNIFQKNYPFIFT